MSLFNRLSAYKPRLEAIGTRIAVPFWGIIGLYGIAGFLIAIGTGMGADYPAYTRHWELVMTGENPWKKGVGGGDNAYGPLYNAFAPFWALHPLLPKLLLAFGTIVLVGVLLRVRSIGGRVPLAAVLPVFVIYAANPLVLDAAFNLGFNDLACAALVGLAAIFRSRRRPVFCGVLLALAGLLKFYPMLLVPFMALSRRGGVRIDIVGVAFGVFAGGLAVGYATWGKDMLAPFLLASGRGASLFSMITFLRDIAEAELLADFMTYANVPIMLATLAALGAYAFAVRMPWLVATCLAQLAILLIYKAGHPQFWTVWLALFATLVTIGDEPGDRRAIWPFALVWIVPTVLIWPLWKTYPLLRPGLYNLLIDLMSLVAFLLGAACFCWAVARQWGGLFPGGLTLFRLGDVAHSRPPESTSQS